MTPLIINVALTGMVPQKEQNPHVPISSEEIVRDARRCFEAGATIAHVHARHPDGTPAFEAGYYRETFAGIRASCPGMLISGSCSGRRYKEYAQRAAVLECQPDLASLTLGSHNFPAEASVNTPEIIRGLAAEMQRRSIVPEWEVFDLGMVDYARYLIGQGVLQPPFYANILLGSLGTLGASASNLTAVVQALPPETTWAATGVGRFQFSVNCLAIAMGGHVRVGLEDSLFYDAGKTQLATNAGLVDRLTAVARAMGRAIATPDEVRTLLRVSDSTSPLHPSRSTFAKPR